MNIEYSLSYDLRKSEYSLKYELPGLDSFPIFRFFDNFPDSFNVNFLYAGLQEIYENWVN